MLELNGICLRKNNILVIRDPAETGDPQCNLMSQKLFPSFCEDTQLQRYFGTHSKAREMRLGLYFLGFGAGGNNNTIWLFKRETKLKGGVPYFPDLVAWPLFFLGLKTEFLKRPRRSFPFPILRECSRLQNSQPSIRDKGLFSLHA